MFVSSFKPITEIRSQTINLLPPEPTLANHINAFKAIPLWRALLNSYVISIGYTMLAMLFCSLGEVPLPSTAFQGLVVCFYTNDHDVGLNVLYRVTYWVGVNTVSLKSGSTSHTIRYTPIRAP